MDCPVNGKTKLLGILGYPLTHTLSPLMHNLSFRELGLNYIYLPLEVSSENLGRAVAGIKALGLVGGNVTIPHKEAVMDYLDEISPEAQIIGAVNTFLNREGKLVGYNTDGIGFVTSLKEEAQVDPQGKRVVILGAGGAARAVAYQLAREGVLALAIFNRDVKRGEGLVADLCSHFPQVEFKAYSLERKFFQREMAGAEIVINTTPLGMYPYVENFPPLPGDLIRPGILVCDLIYRPLETAFLRLAREKGARILSGLGMLVYQGAMGFELWTGLKPPVEKIFRALRQQLALAG